MRYDAALYSSRDYKRSRLAYMNHCHVEWFLVMLIMDAFLAKLLTNVGVDDASVGVIATIANLSNTFQLLNFVIAPRIRNTKWYVLPTQMISYAAFICMYLVPLMPLGLQEKSTLMVVLMVFGYLFRTTTFSIVYRWGNSFVDPHHRAEFTATKESISGLLGMGVSFGIAYMLDVFDGVGNLEQGFLFTSLAMLVFALSDLVCLLLIKNEVRTVRDPDAPTIKEVLQKTFGNRKFVNLVGVYAFYQFGVYLTLGFLGTYQLQELGFSVTWVNIFSIVAITVRAFFAKPISQYSDRNSFAKGISLGLRISLVSFVVLVLTTPQTPWLIVVHCALYQTAGMGAGSNFVNCIYSYVDSRCFSQAMAVMNTISGIAAFLASTLGSALLASIQAGGNVLFGIPAYGQQVLAVLTIGIILICLFFTRTVLEKQEIMIQ